MSDHLIISSLSKSFIQNNLLSTVFSMFNLTVIASPTYHPSAITSFSSLTSDRRHPHAYPPAYFGILYPNFLRQPSAPPSLGIAATDSSPPLALSSHQFHSEPKTFVFEQSFHSLFFCKIVSVLWPLDLAKGFLTVIFTPWFIFTSFIYTSVWD